MRAEPEQHHPDPTITAAMPASAEPTGQSARRIVRGGRAVVFTVLLAAVLAINAAGLPYYASSAAERLRHPLKPWLRPTGPVGQSLGVLAFALFLFLWLYPLLKSLRGRLRVGSLALWLDAHVAAGLLIPLLAATHAGWRFTGLIGLGYGAMFIVALSGIVGRYLYTRIPRSRSGVELGREECAAQRRQLLGELCAETGLAPGEIDRALFPAGLAPRGGLGAALRQLVADDLGRRRAVRAFLRQLPPEAQVDRARLRRVARLARRELALAQRVRALDALHRVFRWWHAAHRPLAVMALVAVLVHVGVAIAFADTWFR